MHRIGIAGAAALLLAGCAAGRAGGGADAGTPVAIEQETIRYETAPCYGTCPVYAVTIAPDGAGTFEGTRFTAVTGIRTFRATSAAYRAFAARLAPYRPKGAETLLQPGRPGCETAPTDMPGVDIVWSEISGGSQHLNLYYGCGPEAMRTALRTAPELLPIAAFIRAGDAPR